MSHPSPASRTRQAVLTVAAHPILPVTNGYALRASNLVRELARRRRVTLIAPVGEASISDLEQALGVARVVPVPQFRGWGSSLDDADRAAIRETIDRVIAEDQPDAAVVWPGADIVREHPRFPPHILDRMDSEVVMAWRDARHGAGLKNRIRSLRDLAVWIRQERALIRSSSATTVDADTDQRVMQLVSGTASVYVVASGTHVPPFAPPHDEAPDPTVAFTGSMSYGPNVDGARWFVCAVWPAVRRRVPSAKLVIAGRQPSSDVQALASVPGVEVRADVPDMRAVLRAAWLAIAPVNTGSGIRTKVLEAWAVGRPVVLSPVGASGLRMDADARSLVAAGTRATTDRVIELLTNTTKRHRLGAAAHALVSREHNGWSAAGDRLVELIDRAAAR